MIIAIDAMGGDFAPKAVVEGALLALQETGEDVCLSLYGDEAQIRACLEGQSYDGGRLKTRGSRRFPRAWRSPTPTTSSICTTTRRRS